MTVHISAIDLLERDPKAEGGKFVLLTLDQTLVLVRGSIKIHEFHAQLLSAYLRPQGIELDLVPDGSDVRSLPARVQMHGGGYWTQEVPGHVEFWGKSAAFGAFNSELLRPDALDAPYTWNIRRS